MAYAAASALLALLLAGCDAGPLGSGEREVEITGAWTFESGRTSEGELTAPLTELVTLSFEPDAAGGFGGCNSYGGQFDRIGGDLWFGDIEQTFMGCDDHRGVFESAYLSSLHEVRHVARDGDRLTLTGGDVSLEFTVMPPWPERAVVARTWRLHTILRAGTRAAGDVAMLYLGKDGKVTAGTGCRSLTGTWMQWRGDVVLTELRMRGTCPAELVEQEGFVLQTLSRFSAEVRGGRELVLTSRGGDIDGASIQLVYRR